MNNTEDFTTCLNQTSLETIQLHIPKVNLNKCLLTSVGDEEKLNSFKVPMGSDNSAVSYVYIALI